MKNPTLQQQRKEIYRAAVAVIDEYRDHYLKAVELIIKKAESDPLQWCWVSTLVTYLRVDLIGFEGVAVKNETVAKMYRAGFQVFGCQKCGSRRWQASGTPQCKPCQKQFREHIKARKREREDFVIGR